MTAATLDLLSGGRFLLGLGTSGPQVVEGWHGQPWGKPLGKTREYVEIVRAALRRDVVEHEGEHYRIPWDGPGATGLGKPLKLMLRPLRAEIPIYLAALGPKNVALAAEIADGWLPIFVAPERFDEAFGPSLAARTRRLRDRRDGERLRRRRRGRAARRAPAVRRALRRRHGREGPELLQLARPPLRLGGRRGADPGALPRRQAARGDRRRARRARRRRLAVGPKERIAERLEAWRETPVTTLVARHARSPRRCRRSPSWSSSLGPMAPPVIVLGVGRSGTTLLRVMLDRSSELAIPYETFFVPQLAHRHGRRPKLDDFLDDLGRLRTLYDWGITPDDVRPRLREGMTTSEAIAAIFETYAERQGKPRWGDKTPLYMQQLPLARAALPGRDLGAPRPRRARRGALVPRAAGGLLGQDVGAATHRAAVRRPVADGDPRGAAARPKRRKPVPRAPLRGSGERAGAQSTARLRARVADVGAGDARPHTPERHRAHARAPQPRPAADAGPPRLAQPDEPRGRARLRAGRGRRPAQLRLRAARARRGLPDGVRTTRARPLRRAQQELERDRGRVSALAALAALTPAAAASRGRAEECRRGRPRARSRTAGSTRSCRRRRV